MRLNFSNDYYKQKALNLNNVNYENSVTAADAFIVLLKDVDYETIDNLCIYISDEFSLGNPKAVYQLIQSGDCALDFKKIILDAAYEMIHNHKNLGNKMVNDKYNASSWIAHSLFEGEVASNLAEKMNLNPNVAMKLGILHDIGRKFDHSFMHTIKGYEYLQNLGLSDESTCCLTHSFLSVPSNGILRGNRCACCDLAEEGFYVDSNGNGVFRDDVKKDDMTLFLENYEYNPYDVILNISDLMAMSSGIASPYDRMLDVYTRKEPDQKNSPFFKVCFINTMRDLLFQMTNDSKYDGYYNIKDFSLEEIDSLLKDTSSVFLSTYNDTNKNIDLSI